MTGAGVNRRNSAGGRTERRHSFAANELGQIVPRSFSRDAWYRFSRERRRRYLAEHAPSWNPTATQSLLISEMVGAERSRLRLEAEAEPAADSRIALELRRLANDAARRILLLNRDLKAATRAREAAKPSSQPPTLHDYLALRTSTADRGGQP
jgi:hypothetical protein